jgi:hypothetical protein
MEKHRVSESMKIINSSTMDLGKRISERDLVDNNIRKKNGSISDSFSKMNTKEKESSSIKTLCLKVPSEKENFMDVASYFIRPNKFMKEHLIMGKW